MIHHATSHGEHGEHREPGARGCRDDRHHRGERSPRRVRARVMRRLGRALVIAGSLMLATAAIADDFDALGAFEKARAEVAAAPRPTPGSPPAERVAAARRLIDAGLTDEAAALLDAATDEVTGHEVTGHEVTGREVTGDEDGVATRCALLLATSRYTEGAALRPELERRAPRSPRAARALVRLLLAVEDLPALDRFARTRLAGDPLGTLAHAEVAWRLNDRERATTLYESVTGEDEERRDAEVGLAQCFVRAERVEDAAAHVRRALELAPLSVAALDQWADVRIRAGAATQATDAYTRIAAWFPWDASSHYSLGNGYSRRNYTQLEADSPAAYPRDEAFVQAMASARAAVAAGDVGRARAALEGLTSQRPTACEPPTSLASLAWNAGDLDAAEGWSREALRREPAHGRAHAILARVVMSRRALANVHRDADEASFAAAREPGVPGIEKLVLDWSSLSPRHRKRVALSIEPLHAFVPVLVEAGQTYYIKQLDERLSETPGHESLKDERIEYDSRLWDDTRGCGGNDTVTGIEDVEGTISRHYDTVLHELSHQVHAILTEADKAEIERCYAAARKREADGKAAFINRYQGSSVWEYFAEGMHASCTRARDKWDTREILLERLRDLDPDLLKLVRRIAATRDVSVYRATALASRAWTDVEYARLDKARELVDKAAALAPEDESVISTSVQLRLYARDVARARDEATAALARHPGSASIALSASDAEVHATGDRRAARALLEAARGKVDAGRLQDVDAAIGYLLLDEGSATAAADVFERVLASRADEPTALQGLMSARAFETPVDAAKVAEVVTRCTRKRAGSRSVRAEAAIALARAGDVDGARKQVAEGLLNAPESDEVLAASAYVEWRAGAREEAGRKARTAMESATTADGCWNDLAALVAALASDDPAALQSVRERATRPPEYVYVEREHSYRSVHGFGPLERELLALAGADAPRSSSR